MSFGRNPYVTRAETAEQKAADAEDGASRTRALRDAAHQWERAAAREKPGKRREQYLENATKNRERADGDDGAPGEAPDAAAGELDDPGFLN